MYGARCIEPVQPVSLAAQESMLRRFAMQPEENGGPAYPSGRAFPWRDLTVKSGAHSPRPPFYHTREPTRDTSKFSKTAATAFCHCCSLASAAAAAFSLPLFAWLIFLTQSCHPPVGSKPPHARDHSAGEYADLVRKAKEEFKCGNLFEVVCSQVLP